MRSVRTRAVSVAAALAALALAAVAGARTSAPVAPATPAAVPAALAGSWATYLPPGAGTQKGRWYIIIGRGGSFRLITPELAILAVGPVSVSGDTLTLPPDARHGGPCTGSGSYSFSVTKKVLRLETIDDGCKERRFRLTTAAWKRVSDFFPVIIVKRR